MKEENKDIIDWLDQKVENVKNVFEQFEAGNYLVDFAAIESLSDQWQSIAPGVEVRVIYRSLKKITLQCKMIKGACLKIHAHPDYIETFRIKTGMLIDKESNSILEPLKGKIFPINTYHTMLSVLDSDMEIDCILYEIN